VGGSVGQAGLRDPGGGYMLQNRSAEVHAPASLRQLGRGRPDSWFVATVPYRPFAGAGGGDARGYSLADVITYLEGLWRAARSGAGYLIPMFGWQVRVRRAMVCQPRARPPAGNGTVPHARRGQARRTVRRTAR
jgi:hypothetical protein